MVAIAIVEALLEDFQSKLPYLIQQFPELKDQIENIANHVDPTPNKAYITWLLRQAKAKLLTPKNMADVRENLVDFDHYKKRKEWPGEKDINRLDVNTLAEQLDKYTDMGGAPLGQVGDLAIHRLTSARVAAKMAHKGTDWCIKKKQVAEEYLQKGPLYMVTKAGRPYVLFQPGKANVRDAYDMTVTDKIAREIAPVMKFVPREQWAKLVDAVSPANMQRRENTLRDVHLRHIHDYMRGINPTSGNMIKPLSKTDAEKMWKSIEPRFRQMLINDPDDALIEKFGLGPNPNAQLLRSLGIHPS